VNPSDRLVRRVDALKAVHAPDPRTAVWEIAVEEGDRRRLVGRTDIPDAIEDLRQAAAGSDAAFEVDLLPDPTVGEAIRAIAHRSLAHLRAEPRHSAELVHQMLLGQEALVLRERNEWLQVRTGDPYVAWVHRGSLVRRTLADPRALRERLPARGRDDDAWIVVSRSAVARAGPGRDAAVAVDLVEGGIVRVGGRDGGTCRIELPDGLVGWVPSDAVVPGRDLARRFPLDGGAALDHAAGFLGLPYLWGGASEKGFDCAGFVQRIFSLHGVDLPRDSDQQARLGRPVDPDPAGPGVAAGDLAFFSEREDGRVTHVGILDGAGRMLHASTTRNGVAWDSLREGERSPFGDRLVAWLTGIRRPWPRPARSR